jgi:serine/threonine-protein kinase RsbT
MTPSFQPNALTIQAVDRGSGIKNLNAILEGQYRSKTGLGLGLAGTRRLADSFHVDTGPGGTTVMVRMKV